MVDARMQGKMGNSVTIRSMGYIRGNGVKAVDSTRVQARRSGDW